MKTVGSIVREWRLANGFKTPADLAKKLGMEGNPGRMNIDNLEKDKTTQPYFIHKLALLMGYAQTQDLLDLKEPPPYSAGSSVNEPPQGTGKFSSNFAHEGVTLEYAGILKSKGMAAVIANARVGEDGDFIEELLPAGTGGWVPSFSERPTFAIRIKGDALSPVYENGVFLVIEPGVALADGEPVVIHWKDGSRSIRRLLFQRPDSLTVEPVKGGPKQTIELADVEVVHPIFGTVTPSRWRASSQ